MNKKSILVALLLVTSAGAAIVPASADAPHEDGRHVCHESNTDDECVGQITLDDDVVIHPGWSSFGVNADNPNPHANDDYLEWVWVEAPDGIHVELESIGSVVGAVDVFEHQRDPDGTPTRDHQTAACPQDEVAPFYPHEGENAATWLNRADRHVRTYHDTSAPDTETTFDLRPRDDGYVLAFYVRAGSSAVEDDQAVEYRIQTLQDHHRFRVNDITTEDRPTFNLPKDYKVWQGNQDHCRDKGLSPSPGVPQDPMKAPELPSLVGPASASTLFGTHL